MTPNSTPTIEINCAGCGSPMRVHPPGMAHFANQYISQVSVFPSWSLDERTCRECKTVNVCVVKTVETVWIAFAPKPGEEQKRIVVPGLSLIKPN